MNQLKMKYRFEQQGNVHKLYVYDDVTACGSFNWETWEYDESETSANYFREQLGTIPESETIDLHVNSCGGEVKEGIAIYNMLKQHKAYKTCYVDGFAYSIASVICMACDKIIMGLGTSMLIHNMSVATYGNAAQLRKMADDLDVLMESNRKIYMERAKGLTEEQLADMMDKETFLTPEQCQEYGFCDEISGKTADPIMATKQMETAMQALRQELKTQKSFHEMLNQFVGETNDPIKKNVTEQNHNHDKALKMMGAFFHAFNK